MVTDFKFKKLAFRTWTPYDITSSWLRFCLTYVYQCVGSMALSVIICIFDTLFAGLLLQICCQLDILVNRLHNIQGTEIESLKRCICHHNTIFRFVASVAFVSIKSQTNEANRKSQGKGITKANILIQITKKGKYPW